MKKLIAYILSVCLLVSVFPASFIYASEDSESKTERTQHIEAKNRDQAEEDFFLPIVVDDRGVTQGNDEVDYIVEDKEVFVDVNSLACENIDVDEKQDCAIITTEDAKIELSTTQDDLVEKDDTLYINLSEVAEECGIKEVKDEASTVYVKPYQTKRLIVEAEGELPDVDASKIIENDKELVLEFDTEADTEEAYEILVDTDGVDRVSGENVYSTFSFTDRDFYAGDNLSWGADYVNSPQIVDYAAVLDEKEEIVVAVVDTGVSTTHPFLEGRIHDKSTKFIGSVDTYEDDNGHGSHVSGIIVDNTPSNVKILALKALDKEGVGYDSNLAKAINYAVEQGADVINMSWGGYKYWVESSLVNAIKNAYNQGVILVAAAGNEFRNAGNFYPSSSTYCITVAATDQKGNYADFSNYGECVAVSAPGVSIKSAYMGMQYEIASGTSMAAPFVAAACATDQTINGKKTPDDMKTHIKQCVTPHKDNSMNILYGTGIIDYSGLVQSSCTESVLFNYETGYYTDEIEVVLSCATEGAEIYYTLDSVSGTTGKKPTMETGILYTGPIQVSESTKIRAVAYTDRLRVSKVTAATYYFNYYDDEHQYVVDENGFLIAYNGTMTCLAVPETVEGVTVVGIGKEVFRESDLELIQLPDTVTTIESYAFYGCEKLEVITARGVKSVAAKSFRGNTKMKVADMPQLVTVGEYAFYNCRMLTGEGISFEHVIDIEKYAFAYTGLSVVKADCAVQIGANAFYYCLRLFSVSMHNVTTVGTSAFGWCQALEYANLPNAKYLEKEVFYDCYALHTVVLAELETIPEKIFSNCSSLKEIPEGCKTATTIGEDAFNNTKIKELDFQHALVVENGAFSYCRNLERFSFPKAQYIGNQSQYSDYNVMDEIDLPEAIYVGGLKNMKVTEVELPKCIALGEHAFDGCRELKKITCEKVVSVGNFSFYGCVKLTDVQLPSLEVLGNQSFINCKSLKKISFPKLSTVKQCFDDSSELEIINLPNVKSFYYSATDMAKLRYVILPKCEIFQSAIMNCNEVKEINLPNVWSFSSKHWVTNDAFADVNIHIPKASGSVLIGKGSYFSLALPKAVTNVNYKCHSSYDEFEPVVFYTRNNQLTVDTDNSQAYTIQASLVLKTDLPTEKVLTNEDYILELSVYCANPVYQWYYSEDGNIYERLDYHNRHQIIPNKKGYYYCHIIDAETEASIDTAVCKVDMQMEMCSMRLESASSVNAMVGNVLFETIENQEEISVPKGAQIQILEDAKFTSVLLNRREEVKPNPVDYSFVLSENTTVNMQCAKMITHANVLIDAEAYVLGKTTSLTAYNVVYNGKVLKEGLDYTATIVYPGMTKKCYYLFQGIGEYTGTVGGEYAYGGADKMAIKDCEIDYIPEQIFTIGGSKIKPQVTVRYQGIVVPTQYYTVSYTNNAKPGTGKVTITGKDKFKGTLSTTFQIYMPMSVAFKSLEKDIYIYTGEEIKPTINWMIGGIDIMADVEYQDNVNVGTGKVIIRGVGPYRGSVVVPFSIVEDIANATAKLEKEQCIYSGMEIKPKVIIGNLVEGKDYVVSYKNNINPGIGTVVVTGIGNYEGKIEKQFTIVVVLPKQVKGLKVISVSTSVIKLSWSKVSGATGYQIYDAYAKKVVKQVTTNSATVTGLKAGTRHNYKVRAYKVINKKMYNGYYSTYVKTATKPSAPIISSAKAGKKLVRLKWKKVTYASGYQIAYSTSSKFGKSTTKYVNVSAKTLKKTVKSLKKEKKYYIKVRAYRSYTSTSGKSTKMYGAYSKVKKVKTY